VFDWRNFSVLALSKSLYSPVIKSLASALRRWMAQNILQTRLFWLLVLGVRPWSI
jgi:hypothetical protein